VLINVRAVQDWEQKRRQPERATRILLTLSAGLSALVQRNRKTNNRLSFSPQQCFADLTTMKYPESVRPIFCLDNEEELETIAFLKLINLG
jgi:hypothetical protein